MPLNNPAHDFSTAQQGYSSMDAPYGNQAFSSSGWLEKEEAKKARDAHLDFVRWHSLIKRTEDYISFALARDKQSVEKMRFILS